MIKKIDYLRGCGILLIALLSACATVPSPQQRNINADTLATAHGWQRQAIPAGTFTLVSYAPISRQNAAHLTVYIEGDGLAWITRNQPSTDPTPQRALALQLALAHPTGNAVYLGRPCQYIDTDTSGCAQRYWTEQRFAPEVIAATSLAIDYLKQQSGARELTLVGYSGGAAVALLTAAKRSDVTKIITVAGNLDHQAWTTYHRISPLVGSLNPADVTNALQMVPQVHFTGEDDKVMPPALTESFAARFAGQAHVNVIRQADFDHQCCWAQAWPGLWSKAQQSLGETAREETK